MPTDVRVLTTTDLGYYDTKLKTWVKGGIKLREKNTTTAGYLKTYELVFEGVEKVNNVPTLVTTVLGDVLDIPRDYLVKHATVETSIGNGDPSGFTSGKKYLDFEINVKGYEGETDAFDDTDKPTADASTLDKIYLYTGATDSTYTNGSYYICQRNGANYEWVETTVAGVEHIYIELDDLMNYTPGDGINITNGAIEVVAAATGGISVGSSGVSVVGNETKGIHVDSTGVEAKISDNLTFTTGADGGKIDIKPQNASSASDANAPAVGGVTKADYVAFNGAINTLTPETPVAPTANSGKNESIAYHDIVVNKTTVGDNTATNVSLRQYYATYGNAVAPDTANNIAAQAGLMTGEEKAELAALIGAFTSNVSLASDSDIDELFPTLP